MRMPILLCVVALPAIFLMVGCGGGGSRAAQEDHAHQSHSAKLDLHPEGGSGVTGTASFEDTSGGVVIKLELRNLPKPNTLYLAHIHPDTCSEGEEEGGAHEHGEEHESGERNEEEGYGHEHGGGAELEYPLSPVKSDSEGNGSSTTTLEDASVERLFSGEPKHVNVHEAGSGNPPILACADLEGGGVSNRRG